MFKPIPGNNEYVISLTQDVRRLDGSKIDIPINNGKISIILYGILINVDLKWLSLIAHFETYLPYSNANDLLNVNFADANVKFFRPVSGKVMVFLKPITIKHNSKQFRVIPCFTRYAVSCDGDVIEIASLQTLKVCDNLKRHGVTDSYPSVYIYNPEKNSYKYIYIHRLVALAWVKNHHNDFEMRPIVNHKDGNKKNYHYKNLEWCSFSENSLHAVNTGLKQDNVACKIRDFNTGIVREFCSLAQASCFMGLTVQSVRLNKLYDVKGRLINNRYELKLIDDKTPWFYENKHEKVRLGRYVIIVTNPNGTIDYFHDLRDFKDKFKIWNCPKLADILHRARLEHPDFVFNYIDYYHNESIQAFDVKNNAVHETKTISEMSKKLNIPEHTIRGCLRSNETRVKNGYAFRYKTDKNWNTNFVQYEKPQTRILATNQVTSEKIKLDSIRQAGRYLNVDRTSIKNSLINGFPLHNWLLTEIKE
jgi:hypothetical protein